MVMNYQMGSYHLNLAFRKTAPHSDLYKFPLHPCNVPWERFHYLAYFPFNAMRYDMGCILIGLTLTDSRECGCVVCSSIFPESLAVMGVALNIHLNVQSAGIFYALIWSISRLNNSNLEIHSFDLSIHFHFPIKIGKSRPSIALAPFFKL